MVAGKLMCPKCDCNLKRYDCVKRIIRHGYEDYPSEATMKRWKRQMVGNISTEVVLTKDES